MNICIVSQEREFGCAKAVIQTVVKTVYDKNIVIKTWFHIDGLGTWNFLGMANYALRQNKIPARFVKKTNVKMEEIQQWIAQEKMMVVLFISNENYPHYAVIAGKDEKSIFIANTHGEITERFDLSEFIERFYMNLRYIEGIQWKKSQHHPIRNRLIRWGMYLTKMFGFVKPGTIYILEKRE